MKILLFKKTVDSDLAIGLRVCYQDLQGNYSKLGIVTDAIKIDNVCNYLLNTSFGSYTADELKLIQKKTI
jgi:hypothetical protein